jgi:transmembrane sensor
MTNDQRLGPPPVEPMSDLAWSRVERGLWSRIDAGAADPTPSPGQRPRAAWRWWLVAAPLTAAAILAVVVGVQVILQESRSDQPVRIVSPRVPPDAALSPAPSSVSFDDSHIELAPDTALVTSHEGGRSQVLLERGAAWFTVAPRGSRPEFVVRAGDAVVRVVGTRFRVARSDERIAVDVDHGTVDVQFRGNVVVVAGGHGWSSESPARASTLAAAPATAAPAAAGEPEEPEIDVPNTRAPARSPAGPKRTPRQAGKPVSLGASADEPAPGPAQAADVDRERAEYERLAALEPTSAEVAQAGYMVLARGTSRWAGLALFAAGRLAADRHDRSAEGLLGQYLHSFPNGANAEDARRLLARLKADQSR